MKGDLKGNGSLNHWVAQLAAVATALTPWGKGLVHWQSKRETRNEPKRINRRARPKLSAEAVV
jgi:hypothetical protein